MNHAAQKAIGTTFSEPEVLAATVPVGKMHKGRVVGKSIVLVAVLTVMLAAAATAQNDDHGLCHQAYLASGLDTQRMSYEEFRTHYGDSAFCAQNTPPR